MNPIKKNRSHCGISCALDVLGDKWSLLIVRDIAILHKKTFKEFAASSEHIATNILADRLKKLEAHGVINKNKAPNNLKVNHYSLTEKGLGLIPVLLELMSWSYDHLKQANGEVTKELYSSYQKDKASTIEGVRKEYLEHIG